MIKVLLLAGSMAIGAGESQAPPRRPVMMQDLTVPVGMLPAGCALAPVPTRISFGRAGGLPANPWIGTDRERVIAIRGGIGARMRGVPDGPPIDAGASSRYWAQLASGVEEAYAAIYTEPEDSVTVQAIRFAPAERHPAPELSGNPNSIRVDIGSIVATVTGNGDCFQTVGAYVKSLRN